MKWEANFLKSLGFPDIRIHSSFNHFDFKRPSRRILVIGPMGSGKTEYSARVWRDSLIAQKKSDKLLEFTSKNGADRRRVFFIRSSLDLERFPDYPKDALPYRGGYERCGTNIAEIKDSFGLEEIIRRNPDVGTWIIDEASFYEERLAYVVENESRKHESIFIFPTLVLNFRKEIFNSTTRLLLETATDIFPLTAYCEHPDCLEDSFNTYRYYLQDGLECPALYFDPLIIIGGDQQKTDPREPNYCTRCDTHHYLPGKEYTFLILKPLGEQAASGDINPLKREMERIKFQIEDSSLYQHSTGLYLKPVMMNALRVPCIAEKALIYLFNEQNLIARRQLFDLIGELKLDQDYITRRLQDNRRIL